ncbi:hypothetical protein NE237_028819 [Protea cynaroides]|uniref:Major facilitator superfamily (MFS) profile domain-containing protein n=1 Tax=Protea cynaroides TaxID=273540 RepID=A0A9Q0GU22_9MAGN|nr:hypothetical protein NE237_028819 [Protea cynaroides]
MLQRVRGTVNIQAELDDLIQAIEISKSMEVHPFRMIIQARYRPQLVMAIAIPFIEQVTGINVIAFYAPLLFRTMGFGESASLISAIVTGLVGTGTTFISMLIVDKVGRRSLFMFGGVPTFISQMIIGGLLAVQLGDQGGLSKGYVYLLLFLICVYVAGFGWSWGPLGWFVPSENFQLEIRSAGQSITILWL